MRRFGMVAAMLALAACASPEPDAIDDVTVLTSGQTVEDSTIACAVYRTDDQRVGLMTPAMVVRRVSDSTVVAEYDQNVAMRCTPLLESRGLTVTAAKVHKVEKWSMKHRERRTLKNGAAWRT